MTIPFPPYRPTSWELQLPNYRVITNSWRSTEIPEILGSLPEDARLRLRYENITDQQALELLLLWRATAGGYYPLNTLPAEVAAGINNAALANRIRSIAPLSWVVADPPRQESIKNLRSGVDIELKSELRFVPSIAIPTVACPVYVPRQYSGCIGFNPGPELPPGIEIEGEFNPTGLNRVCITEFSVDRYTHIDDSYVDTLFATEELLDCFDVAGSFSLAPTAAAATQTVGGVTVVHSISLSIYSADGTLLLKVNMARYQIPPFEGFGIRNPLYKFTIAPVGGDPADFLSWTNLLIAIIPPDGGPNLFAYPGYGALVVNMPA